MSITWKPRYYPWVVAATAAYFLGVAITFTTGIMIICNKGDESTEALRNLLTTYVVVGVLLGGLGQLMGAAAHGTVSLGGKRVEGWGKIVGLFGWSFGVMAVIPLALEETDVPEWILIPILASVAIPLVAAVKFMLFRLGSLEESTGSYEAGH